MKRTQPAPEDIPIEDRKWTRVLRWEEIPILTLELHTPGFPGDTPGLRRLDRYYRQVAEQWRTRWEGVLFARAQEAAAAAREASRPFRPWEASLSCTITFRRDGLLSLYQDAYEYTGGNHGLTVRRGDTWRLPGGTPCSLRSFLPPRSRWRALIGAEIGAQISARVDSGCSLFDPDWPRLLRRSFDPERFYLTPEGIAVFFPLYAIAPYAEGIPVFLIPYPEAPPSP